MYRNEKENQQHIALRFEFSFRGILVLWFEIEKMARSVGAEVGSCI